MGLFDERAGLLAAFRAGERDALEEVYFHEVDFIERLVRHGFFLVERNVRVNAAVSDIDDLVQEVFARAFADRARQAYDGLRDYRPYLATIARNLLVDWARRRGRELPLEALSGEPASEPAGDDPAWADAATIQVVADYLASLPPDLRAVHQARYVEGKSQRDAAVAIGLSRQQLRTREERLRDGLRRALAKKDQPKR